MRISLHNALISSYKEHGKNPNYSLSFLLNSIDPGTCVAAVKLINEFSLLGETTEFEVDEKNILIVNQLFSRVDATLLEQLLWAALLLPEI